MADGAGSLLPPARPMEEEGTREVGLGSPLAVVVADTCLELGAKLGVILLVATLPDPDVPPATGTRRGPIKPLDGTLVPGTTREAVGIGLASVSVKRTRRGPLSGATVRLVAAGAGPLRVGSVLEIDSRVVLHG